MFILDACGGLIPSEIAQTIGSIYNILLIAIPVMIVLFGTIDFVKAVMAGKEDDIKKSTNTFVKRLITGLIVFFILAIVKLILNVIQTGNTSDSISCLNEIFGNSSKQNE